LDKLQLSIAVLVSEIRFEFCFKCVYSNGEYQVTTFRTGFRKTPLDCIRLNGTALDECVGNITTNLATMEVFLLDYAYIVYSESPRYPVNYNKLRYFIHFSLPICCRMLADKSALCVE
jgi:hypothetical protein